MVESWPGTQCLVIGGAGNLGSHLIEQLVNRQAQVSSFDRFPYKGSQKGVVSIEGDICDRAAVLSAMGGVRVVFHVASVIDIRPIPSPNLQKVNVDGTSNVVECCKSADVGILIYTSSMDAVSGVSADWKRLELNGADESIPIPAKHHLPYGATKAAAEAMVLAAHSGKLWTCALRPGYIVGPGCIGMKLDMEKAFKRKHNHITAVVPAKMSCVHVQNCAVAHVLAAERVDNSSVGGQTFFISDFNGNTTELAIQAFKGTGIKCVTIPFGLACMIAFVLDRLYRFLHLVFTRLGYPFEIPSTVIDVNAARLAWDDLCFSVTRAFDILGYDQEALGLVTEKECAKQSNLWAIKFYKGLCEKQLKDKGA
mmetsp:Transcript_11460/g.30984  ORF Transcript_11460/g.30984 Transcript_11460/m.30984 type:complete len:367 (-) Transcript_11460:26-1126(-)